MKSKIVQLLKTINSYKSTKELCELINDIEIIDAMTVEACQYDEDKVSYIAKKYKDEIDFLWGDDIELNNRPGRRRLITKYQQLLYLRHCLIRIATMIVLKQNNEEELLKYIFEDDDKIKSLLRKVIKKNNI